MSRHPDAQRWDERHRAAGPIPPPSPVLAALADRLPAGGRALDLACGTGRHALFLLERGYRTTAIDVSLEGVDRAVREARARGFGEGSARPGLDGVVADLARFPLPRSRFRVIVCVRYLERSLFPAIEAALEPGGVLFYETFTRAQLVFPEAHPRREEFLLAPGELPRCFPGLEVLHFEETERASPSGIRSVEASLLARRPNIETSH